MADTVTEAARQAHLQSYVRYANEVAVQFPRLSDDDAAVAVAAHIRRYWDPSIRADLQEHLDAGGADLLPIALAAARLLHSG
ncbi:MAG: formate dehydrogenase subunit delta [Candidatus Nanopelagicales bacterium]